MTASALLLDTKGWILALEGNEEPYARALAAARPAIVPGLVLAEVDYWFQTRRNVMHDVLRDIATGAYQYEPPTVEDLERAREIDAKFSKHKIGLVDASIAALGERLGVHRVLTTDSDFVSIRFGNDGTRASSWRCRFRSVAAEAKLPDRNLPGCTPGDHGVRRVMP